MNSSWKSSTPWPRPSTAPATRRPRPSRAPCIEALDYVTKTLRGNNDEELGKWTMQCDIYKGHPYGHPDRGTVQGLKAITLDDVKAFHKRYYTREALTLGMAGGFEPAAAS